MARYLVIYSTGKSIVDGKCYYYESKDLKDYEEELKEIKRNHYTIINHTPIRKEKGNGKQSSNHNRR